MTDLKYTDERDEIMDAYNIPTSCRKLVADRAWEEGHAHGYKSVLSALEEICEFLTMFMKTKNQSKE